MKYLKQFEDIEKNIELALTSIYKGAPPINFSNKNHIFIMNKLEKLIGKVVSFKSNRDLEKKVKGLVTNVAYDNTGGNNILYISFDNNSTFHSIKSNITIYPLESDAHKFNI